MLTLVKPLQDIKALTPIVFIDKGRTIVVKLDLPILVLEL